MPSGYDEDPQPKEIELVLGDGRVVCRGLIIPSQDAELTGVDDDGVVHQTSTDVEVHVIEDGEIYMDGEVTELEPGDYLLNERGFWRRVDVA